MRMLLTLVVGVVVLMGVVVPFLYFYLSSDLPPLSNRVEVEKALKLYVEGQRQQALAGIDPTQVEPFAVLTRDRISEGLLAGALTTEGCPDYFSSPSEEGWTWLSRNVGYGLGQGLGGPGPGRCELRFSDRLANVLGLPTGAHRAVAIYNFHHALTKEELLLDELSSRYFYAGIIGVRAASKKLFGKEPRALSLAESAELLLAEVNYKDILNCHDPNTLFKVRNNVLEGLAAMNLVKREAVDRAKKEKLHCLSRPG
jgi:hypothetical protein